MTTGRWNHSIHYHPVVLRAVPARATRALDIGCGEGTLVRQLRPLVDEVIGIDRDEPSLGRARLSSTGGHLDVHYVLGDFLTYPFEQGSFDLVTAVASLHHMDSATALERMQELLRPGGALVVVGLARNSTPADLLFDLGGALAKRLRQRKTSWDHLAPTIWPPPESYSEVRRTAARVLPGVRYRRHILFRYSLTWTKPETPRPTDEWQPSSP